MGYKSQNTVIVFMGLVIIVLCFAIFCLKVERDNDDDNEYRSYSKYGGNNVIDAGFYTPVLK